MGFDTIEINLVFCFYWFQMAKNQFTKYLHSLSHVSLSQFDSVAVGQEGEPKVKIEQVSENPFRV